MKRSDVTRMMRQARAPRERSGPAWTRLMLLLVALVGLLASRERLGTAGAGCFATLTGDVRPTMPASSAPMAPANRSEKR